LASHRDAGPPGAAARRRRGGLHGSRLPRRALRPPVRGGDGCNRALPRRPRARGRPAAADRGPSLAWGRRPGLPARPGPGGRRPLTSWDDESMNDRPGRIELYLLRHADAGDPEAWTRPDAERP